MPTSYWASIMKCLAEKITGYLAQWKDCDRPPQRMHWHGITYWDCLGPADSEGCNWVGQIDGLLDTCDKPLNEKHQFNAIDRAKWIRTYNPSWANVRRICYDFSLSNLSAYLISSYLGASLIFSRNNLHIVRLFDLCSPRSLRSANTRMDTSRIQTPTHSI